MKMFLAVILAATQLWACPASNNPYGVAAKGSDDVAVAINQIETQVDGLHKSGEITSAEEKAILSYANFANAQNGVFQQCVSGVHKSNGAVPAYVACAQTELAAMNDPVQLAAVHVSNPQSQAKVQSIIGTVALAINGVITALNALGVKA